MFVIVQGEIRSPARLNWCHMGFTPCFFGNFAERGITQKREHAKL